MAGKQRIDGHGLATVHLAVAGTLLDLRRLSGQVAGMKLWLVDVRDVSSCGLHGAVVAAEREGDALRILGVTAQKYRVTYLGEAREGCPKGTVLESHVL